MRVCVLRGYLLELLLTKLRYATSTLTKERVMELNSSGEHGCAALTAGWAARSLLPHFQRHCFTPR